MPNYQNINHHHQHQPYHYNHNQYIVSNGQCTNNLIQTSISPSQSPQPFYQINKQTSPVNLNNTATSSNIENNSETNSGKVSNNTLNANKISSNIQQTVNNLVSVSPSSSSSCSSTSTTSSVSSNSSVSNKSNDDQSINNGQAYNNQKNLRKNSTNDFINNTTGRSKEQKSFRKYNSNSFSNSVNNNLLDKFFNNSSNVVSTALINTKPYHSIYNKSKERNDQIDSNQLIKSTRTLVYTQNNYNITKVSNKKQPYHQQHLISYNHTNNHQNHQLQNSYSLHSLQNFNNHVINEQQKQYNHQANQFCKNNQNYNQIASGFAMDQGKQLNDEYIMANSKRQTTNYENISEFLVKSNKTALSEIPNDNKTYESDKLSSELLKNLEFFRSILNKIKKPTVCDIEAQSVLVRLTPIALDEQDLTFNETNNSSSSSLSSASSPSSSTDNNNSHFALSSDFIQSKFENLNYTLELSGDKNSFNEVYTGDANEITLKDLRPNTKYFLRVFASLDNNCRGDYTSAVPFQTEPCQPDQPMAPKQTGLKKKNEIALKWNSANDNGAKIINYILEFKEYSESTINSKDSEENNNSSDDDEKQENFTLAYKGPLKQFIAKKLKPSTCYVFRLAAENSFGISDFSRNILSYTSGCVPNVPESPILVDSTITSLTLSWQSTSKNNLEEIDYELQMLNTEDSVYIAHGFLTVYNGTMLSYKITSLKLCCIYQFRVI